MKENCDGNYVNIDPENTKCVSDYEAYSEVSMILVHLFGLIILSSAYYWKNYQVTHSFAASSLYKPTTNFGTALRYYTCCEGRNYTTSSRWSRIVV